MVPAYRATTPPVSAAVWAGNSYTPLAVANHAPTMGQTGYHGSIGLIPEWDVVYLTSAGDVRAWHAVQINAYCAGRYSIHYRDQSTNRPLRFSQYPTKTLNPTNIGVTSTGTSADPTPAPTSGPAATYARSHSPAFGYLAYLMTGRFYFMEQVQFQATVHYLAMGDHATLGRNLSEGRILTWQNQTRGAAWMLRTLAMATCVTPDDDANLKTEFTTCWNSNVNWYHNYYVVGAKNALGYVTHSDDANTGDAFATNAPWQDDFVTGAFGLATALKVATGTASTNLDAFFAWKARAIVGRLGGQGTDQFCYRNAANYTMPMGPTSGNTESWYSNFGQVYQAAYGVNSCNSATTLEGSSGADPGGMATGYWGNLMPAIAYAVDHSVQGAADAYTRLVSASNWATGATGFNDNPTWSVKPLSR